MNDWNEASASYHAQLLMSVKLFSDQIPQRATVHWVLL